MWLSTVGSYDGATIISTHTSRVGCDEFVEYSTFCDCISTHTSRVGCDLRENRVKVSFYISTHTSRVGCDNTASKETIGMIMISTHTSRVGCDDVPFFRKHIVYISTHTSRVGCDLLRFHKKAVYLISTHTSRVGCDNRENKSSEVIIYFYSHIPCGMWLLYIVYYSLSIPIYHEMDL